ncbi:hypothetical protein WN944_003334 [Citrus x changshan-huyou]|uniref:Secreted protein n=1 Tax=Citrus x changshan-huyou TaxID=2935761 RepID=A0AAP0LZ95_9ROSI
MVGWPCSRLAALPAPLLALSLTSTVEHARLLLWLCSRLASSHAPLLALGLTPTMDIGQPTDASTTQLLLTTHRPQVAEPHLAQPQATEITHKWPKSTLAPHHSQPAKIRNTKGRAADGFKDKKF